MRQGAMPIGRALSIATQTFCTAICNICHWEYQIDFQNIMKRLPTCAMFVGHSTHLNITVFLLSVQTGSLTSWAEGGVVTGWWVRERKHCGNVRSVSICAFVYLYLWSVYLCICGQQLWLCGVRKRESIVAMFGQSLPAVPSVSSPPHPRPVSFLTFFLGILILICPTNPLPTY